MAKTGRNPKFNTLEGILSHTVQNANGCMIWKGAKSTNGYAQIKQNGKTKRANRIVKQLQIGRELRSDECAMHTCDTPLCLNPDHLVIGSTQDNTADMVRKGRQARWERHHNAKLTVQQVGDIRREYESGMKLRELAPKYGVSEHTISNIVQAQTWQSLPGQYLPRYTGKRVGVTHPMAKLTESQVIEIRRLYDQGFTTYQLADMFNVHQSQAWSIVAWKTWKHLPRDKSMPDKTEESVCQKNHSHDSHHRASELPEWFRESDVTN